MSQPLLVRQLTRSERVRIQRLRQKPPSVSARLRTQAVLLSRQGRTVQEIGDIVGRNRSTVFRWLQAFDKRGLDALHPGKSPGAPRKADAEYQAALSAALQHNPRDLGYAFRSYCKTVYMTFNHEPISHDRSVLPRVGETPKSSCRFARSTGVTGDDG